MTTAGRALLDEALHMESPPDENTERILSNAREQFCWYGIQRSSMEDIARRSGVSRVTIYRRFENKNVLIERVLLRALHDFFAEFIEAMRTIHTLEDRVVEGFVLALRSAREDPLMGGLLRVEPETMLPFMTTEGGPVIGALRDFLAAQLLHESKHHTISGSDVPTIAEMMVRLTVSFLLTPQSHVDLDSDEAMREFARRYIVPMLT